jgi:hypothetical protein
MLLFFCDIRSTIVNKHSELTKRQARDRYGRFASPSSHTAPPISHHEVGSSSCHRTAPPPLRMQEVGSSSRRRTAPPPSRQEETSSDDSVEMWVVAPPPPLRLQVAPPPPPTRVEELSDDSPSDSLGYNDKCPYVKEVSSYELLLFNCLVQLLNVHIHFQIQKLEKISYSRERTAVG